MKRDQGLLLDTYRDEHIGCRRTPRRLGTGLLKRHHDEG